MYMLGIDVGSSFLKSSILNLHQMRVEDSCSVPTPSFVLLVPERKEIPMEELAEAVRQLIRQAQKKYTLEGIVFSVQMHGFMLFTPQGNAVSNYISWQDLRVMVKDKTGKSLYDRLKETVPENLFVQDGISLKPNHSLLPLYHYIKENPPQEPLEFAMLGDGLTRLLTGKEVSIHPTQAASSGLYDLQKKDWNWELISLLGLDCLKFPKVRETTQPVASYHTEYGDVPIYSALGDHQAALFGTGAEVGDIVINIGTGGQICYVDPILEYGGKYEIRPFFQNCFLRAMTQLPSGRSLNVLMKFVMSVGKELFECSEISETEIWGKIDKLNGQMAPASCGLHLDFSFFENAGGTISGITGNNFTAPNLFYEAYRSMAKKYLEAAVEILTPKDHPKRIICTGGVMRKNPLLKQCIQEEIGLPCLLAPYSDDTMVGLMRYVCWCRRGISPSRFTELMQKNIE